MTTDGAVILERLEAITTSMTAMLARSGDEAPNLQASGLLLAERGELIAKLAQQLEGDKTLTYVEFNRLVIVHAQGGQIASSLIALRTTLANVRLQAQRQRAYTDRLQGMLEPAAANCSEKA